MNRFFKKMYQKIKPITDEISRRFGLGKYYKLNMISSSISFYFISGIFPAIYLVIELLRLFNNETFNNFVNEVVTLLPSEFLTLLELIAEQKSFSNITVDVFFLVMLLVSVSKIARIVITSSELVYTKKLRDFRGLQYFLGILVTFLMLFVLLALIVVYSIVYSIINYLNGMGVISLDLILTLIDLIIVPFSVFVSFLVIYALASPYSKRIKDNWAGAFFASIAVSVITYFFSNYSYIFTRESIYGPFSGVLLFLIWLYSCSYSFSLGLTFNAYLAGSLGEER